MDKNSPYYEKWKQGIERKRREDAEWKRREEKPGYKLITRGPRKGMLVPKNWNELKQETRERSREQFRLHQQERKNQNNSDEIDNSVSKQKPATQSRSGDYSIFGAFILVVALSLMSYGAAVLLGEGLRMVHAAYCFFPVIFIDFIAWRTLRRRHRYSKYLPLIWWL